MVAAVACGQRDRVSPGAGAGSGDSGSAVVSPPAAKGDAVGPGRCERLAFAPDLDLAEASGAVLTRLEGRRWLVVVSDSGHRGAYALVDPATGIIGERGHLPLAPARGRHRDDAAPRQAADDLEALAWRDEQLIGLSSAGWIRRWRRDGAGFALVGAPVPLLGADAAACPAEQVNCGRNYEGLCLGAGPADGRTCVGMAAAKATGRLVCVVEEPSGRLAVDDRRSLVFAPQALSGCDLGADGSLWLGANLLAGNAVWRLTGWASPGAAVQTDLGPLGDSFAEAIAVDVEADATIVYRLGDHGGRPSRMAKFRCRPGPQ